MKKIVLSKRLQAVADMVSPGSRVCDVGCDHGFVSIYLVEQGISERVIAMDVRLGPLEQARGHINDRNLSKYIETRLSDGIRQLETGEADTAILAGMGGRLMARILGAEPQKTEGLKELILQPQSEVPVFRKLIRDLRYAVIKEEMVFEEGKFYPMMKVIPAGNKDLEAPMRRHSQYLPEQEDRWGRFLLEGRHPVLKQYLKKELEKYQQIMQKISSEGSGSDRKQKRRQKLQKEIEEIEQILKMWR